MSAASLLSLFGRLDRPFLVPAKTASAVARGRGQGRPHGRRASRASLDGDEHGRTLSIAGTRSRTPRAGRATAASILLSVSLLLACPVRAQDVGPARESAELGSAIEEAARRFELPTAWIRAVIAAESGGDRRAVSAKGAMGLMQLMPGTWSDLRADLNLGPDPFDRRDNVLAGSSYLRRLLDRFGPRGFLAAYNAGPARYRAHLDGARRLPPETIAYVARVESMVAAQAGPDDFGARSRSDWRAADLFATRTFSEKPTADGIAVAPMFVRTGGEVRP